MKKHGTILSTIIFICTASVSFAQVPGDPDTTFNTSDQGYEFSGGTIYDMVMQPDNKILIGGSFQFGGCHTGRLARINAADRKYDVAFNSGGSGPNGDVIAMAVQNDGKIIIGGLFTTYNGITANHLARLNSNGSLDTTFKNVGAGPAWSSQAGEMALQSDGKIIIGGYIPSYDGNTVNNIVRVNSDGSYDNTFIQGTGANQPVYSIAVQADNKILIAGGFTSYDGNLTNYIARLNANGSYDNTFLTGTGLGSFGSNKNNIAIQSTGKIIVTGSFTAYDGNAANGLVRLNANGTFDATFNASGSGPGSGAVLDGGMALEDDDKIFIRGTFTSYNGVSQKELAKLNADGTLDVTFFPFSSDFSAYTSTGNLIAVGSDKRPVLYLGGPGILYDNSGNIAIYRHTLARYKSDGVLEDELGTTFGPSSEVRSLAIQSDGKILIGGSFAFYNGKKVDGIARAKANGDRDSTFGSASTFVASANWAGSTGFTTNRPVNSVVIQSDGNILLATKDNVYPGAVIRLKKTDGLLDGAFTPQVFNGDVYTIAVQSDNRIVVGGGFSSINYITRLNFDGTFDGSFTGLAQGEIKSLAIQPDGKIIIGGTLTNYGGNTIGHVTRINADGTWDNTFNVSGAGADGDVNSVTIQTDGKIIIGGSFTSYNGVPHNKIARLNADGTIDNSFTGTGFNLSNGDYVNSIVIQTDGKIIAAGKLSTYNGTVVNQIARINTNGTYDCSFIPGSGFSGNPFLKGLALQTDGNIIAGGNQTTCSYNGSHKMGLYRIRGGNYNSNLGVTIPKTDVPCFGGTNGLASAVTSGGTAPFTYSWTGPSFTASTQTITVPFGTYSVVITDAAGCTTTNTVSINQPLVLNSFAGPDTNVCLGSGVLIGASPVASGGTTPFTYSWTNGTFLNNSTLANPTANPTSLTNFTLTVTDAHGCTATDITIVTVKSLPAVVANVTATTICTGTSVTFTGGGASSYVWTGGVTDGAGFVPSGTLTYTVTGTGGNGCTDTATITVNVNTMPGVGTTLNGAVITANQTGATYQWIDCSDTSAIAGAVNQSYTVTTTGNYAVLVTLNGCADTSACVNVLFTGVAETRSTDQLGIYPNPNNGTFAIQSASEGTYYIIDGLGQTVHVLKLNASNNYSANIENMGNGHYFISGLNNNQMMLQKIVVAR